MKAVGFALQGACGCKGQIEYERVIDAIRAAGDDSCMVFVGIEGEITILCSASVLDVLLSKEISGGQ